MTFMDPWSDPFNTGFQLTQALIAFGRGEWFGVGLGNSVQKLFYLPEPHSDFIYAVISEELGLVGATVVLPADRKFGGILGTKTLARLGATLDFGSYSLLVPKTVVSEK